VASLLYRIAIVALALAVGIGVALSSRLSEPVDRLVAFVQGVAAGKLDARAEPVGPVELRVLAGEMNRMVGELKESRQQMVAKERLEKEMEISSRIQTSILPRKVEVPGLEVAARMIPATEVGGDYYDVFPAPGGCFIGVGDVAGHGLTSGLIMLMVQSVIAGLGRKDPDAPPREIVRVLNAVLFDNIRHRLGNDEHVTFSLLRYRRDGRVVFAGAHEEIVICRAATGKCELVSTPGPWLGAMADVGQVTEDSELLLSDGDVMVLYTDGVTETMDKGGEQFGIERLMAAVEGRRTEPVEKIRDAILDQVAQFGAQQDDDVTLLIVRYHAEERHG
jgi:sigma-B regulation protein RsbU (phosphoserine phosphatase)